MWTTVINIVQILDLATAGRGALGPPAFLGKSVLYKQTWETHDWNRVTINCAAFALCNFLNNRDYYDTRVKFADLGKKARERSMALQTRLCWGESVSISQLGSFVEMFPEYQVTAFCPLLQSIENSTLVRHTGAAYKDDNNNIDLVFHKAHWAWCSSIQQFINGAQSIVKATFCRDCLAIVRNPDRLPIRDLSCHLDGPPAKKIKKSKPCSAPQCNGHVHGPEDNCHFKKCPACDTINCDNSHRCSLLPKSFGNPPPHEKYWSNEKDDYEFCTDEDGDGKTPAFFAYDLETMIRTKTLSPKTPRNLDLPHSDENFGYSKKDLSDIEKELERLYVSKLDTDDPEISASLTLSTEYNEMVPNLVVCTNIYSSKLPKNPGDPPYSPKMYRFEGPDCMEKFINFAMEYNKGRNYFCAHNGSGFDSKFIYQRGLDMELTIEQIMRGSNFISLKFKHGKARGNKTVFIDNMLHLSGSLAGLAKDFFGKGPDENLRNCMSKGYFPHGFNRAENQDYVGPIPHIDNFTIETMRLGDGESRYAAGIKLQAWHANFKGDWDFRKEIVKYCDLDVVILAALMKEYMSIGIPKGAIPLMYTTAPAYVHELIMLNATKHLVFYEMNLDKLKKEIKKEKTMSKEAVEEAAYARRKINTEKHLAQMDNEAVNGWAVLKPPEYNMVRLSLRGGRTEIRSSIMTLSPEEEAEGTRILYQDVTSLYPAMQLTKKFPIGTPEINCYDYEFRPCYDCRNIGGYSIKCLCEKKGYTKTSLNIKECHAQPTADEILADESFFGYVCVDLLPPSNLYHPVIQIRKTTYAESGAVDNVKCQNNLVPEDHLELYLDTPTLKKALQSGYKLLRVHRFDKYKSGIGAWVGAGIEFYVDKERTSGPAPSATSRGKHVAEYCAEFPDKPEPSCDRDAYIALNEFLVPGLGSKLLAAMEEHEWSFQPAKRKVFKIFNNCGWGKHAQRPVMPSTSTLETATQSADIATIFQNITNGTSVLGGVQAYNQGRKLLFTVTEAKKDPNLSGSYLAAACMVPAYGRLCLLEGLETAGERVAMCDTDSIVYKSGKTNIPKSGLLGRFKEEDISLEIITEFVGFGPKCYSIKTKKMIEVPQLSGGVVVENNTYTKLKGISQTIQTQAITHDDMFKTMENYLKTGELGAVSVPQWGIKTAANPDGQGPCVYTTTYMKKFKLMDETSIKGYRLDRGEKIYPFGFLSPK